MKHLAASPEQLRARLELRRGNASAKHINAARAGVARQRTRGAAKAAAVKEYR